MFDYGIWTVFIQQTLLKKWDCKSPISFLVQLFHGKYGNDNKILPLKNVEIMKDEWNLVPTISKDVNYNYSQMTGTFVSSHQKKLVTVFSEKTDVPQLWIFVFSTIVSLKISK